MTQTYNLAFTVPVSHADAVCQAIGDAGAGKMGNYTHCSVSMRVEGRFMALEGANPAIGSIGVMEKVEEERIEVMVSADDLKAVVAALKKSHPYEEIYYGIYPLYILA